MIASNRGALPLALAALILALYGSHVRAQNAPSSAAAPVSILPQSLAPEPPAESENIAVGELAAPPVERIGLVDVSKGGFPTDLWTGIEPETLKQLLTQLPRLVISQAQRKLAENLLLSPAGPPSSPTMVADSGANPPTPAADSGPWLLEMRVRALGAMGDWTDALALLELVPADHMTDTFRRLRADGNLAMDRINPVCGDAREALKTSTDFYWQKIQVFCQLAADQAGAASLGINVLREQRLDDPAFFWLADMMQGGSPALPQNLGSLQPVHMAMLRRASGALPESLLNSADPTTLGALAALPLADPNADPADKTPAAAKRERQKRAVEMRMALAERALAAGTLDPDVLRKLYRQWDPKLDPKPPSLTNITADDIRGRALLFQSAQLQTIPTARAEVISRAIAIARADHGENGPDITVVGRVYAPLLAELEPGAELVWFAADAARALLAAGEDGKARVWLDLARNMGRTSSDAALIADNIWLIERLSGAERSPRAAANAFHAWAATLPAQTADAQTARALNLLVAVGEPVTMADWRLPAASMTAPESASVVSPSVWSGLAVAARNKSAGPGVLFSLMALGENGSGRASSPNLQRVIETLVATGRERDARALALEAALVQGL